MIFHKLIIILFLFSPALGRTLSSDPISSTLLWTTPSHPSIFSHSGNPKLFSSVWGWATASSWCEYEAPLPAKVFHQCSFHTPRKTWNFKVCFPFFGAFSPFFRHTPSSDPIFFRDIWRCRHLFSTNDTWPSTFPMLFRAAMVFQLNPFLTTAFSSWCIILPTVADISSWLFVFH